MEARYHIKLTKSALQDHFSFNALKEIIAANLAQDALKNQLGAKAYSALTQHKEVRMWSRCHLLLWITLVTLSIATPGAAATLPPTNPFPVAEVPGNAEFARAIAYDSGRGRYLVVNTNEGALNAGCLDASG